MATSPVYVSEQGAESTAKPEMALSCPLSVTELTSEQEFHLLRDEWDELVANDPTATVFQTWEFQYYARGMVPEQVLLNTLLVRDSCGRLVGCAPLGTLVAGVGPLQLRILQFACSRWADYSAIIAREGSGVPVLIALAHWLRQHRARWDLIRLGPLRADGTLRSHLDVFVSEVGLPHQVRVYERALFIRFEAGWGTYQDVLKGLGKHWAKKRRQEVRRLMHDRGAVFRCVSRQPDLDVALSHLMDLHQTRQQANYQLGRFGQQRVRHACRDLVDALATQGKAAVHVLELEGHPLVALCTFDFRGTRSLWIIGTDTTDEKISPGHVLHALCIDDALSKGIAEFDFLVGREPYKLRWASEERPLHLLELQTGSWRCAPYLWRERWRARLVKSERLRSMYMHLFTGARSSRIPTRLARLRFALQRTRLATLANVSRALVRRLAWTTVNLCFDVMTGIDTRGWVSLERLGLDPASGALDYQPTSVRTLQRVFRHLPISPDDVFVDFGSGKGRVVFWAAHYPFRRVIGVELSEQLNQIARRNLARNRHRVACQNVEFVTADAAEYELPDDITIAYLFNPFSGGLFVRALDSICRSLERRPRTFRIIYTNPVMRADLTRRGFRETTLGGEARLYQLDV